MIMKEKSFKDAILMMMQDAQQFKRDCHWCKASVEIFPDYIDAEYRVSCAIHAIPDNRSDKWRLFASGDDIVLSFIYLYEDEGQ